MAIEVAIDIDVTPGWFAGGNTTKTQKIKMWVQLRPAELVAAAKGLETAAADLRSAAKQFEEF